MRTLVVFVSASVSASMLAAQCPPSEGAFAGVPVALSTQDGTGTALDPAQAYHKKIGFLSTKPAAPAFANGFQFDLGTALRTCLSTVPPDVDALSLGLDWVLADNVTGKVAIPKDRWASLLVSVTPTTVGKAGGPINAEVGRSDGAAADVFSFWVPGSTLPAELVDRTQRAVDSREVDFGTGTVKPNVDAVDAFIPMFGLEPGILAMLPLEPRMFFSVSAATLSRAPASWWGGGQPSAATILSVRWIIGTKTWTCPQPFLTHAQLGLSVDEDVDALALDLDNQRVLFSTKTSRRNPILFTYYGTDAAVAAVPYTAIDNVPISEKLGLLGNDDIDGICSIDPSIRTKGSARNPAYYVFSTPRPTALVPYKADLSASSFRDWGNNKTTLQTHVVGWPVPGQGSGFAVLFLTLPDSFNPAVLLTNVARDPLNPICGDPRRQPVDIPVNLSLQGTPLYLRWFVADKALTWFNEAHPLQVRI